MSVSYASADDHRYVSLSGRASLIQDTEKMKELWSPVYRAWFPQGLDDPEPVLLRVDVDKAEYWDVLAAAMVDLL